MTTLICDPYPTSGVAVAEGVSVRVRRLRRPQHQKSKKHIARKGNHCGYPGSHNPLPFLAQPSTTSSSRGRKKKEHHGGSLQGPFMYSLRDRNYKLESFSDAFSRHLGSIPQSRDMLNV
ncbi:MAG: hypothetical protein WA441_06395 [Methyloceanibacter sp.]